MGELGWLRAGGVTTKDSILCLARFGLLSAEQRIESSQTDPQPAWLQLLTIIDAQRPLIKVVLNFTGCWWVVVVMVFISKRFATLFMWPRPNEGET